MSCKRNTNVFYFAALLLLQSIFSPTQQSDLSLNNVCFAPKLTFLLSMLGIS